ncbi:MAG: protein-methionine-sulfoxide reductase heme-binding subunit MsrQ [Alphaproteobacteria bacterium]|nr:sulfoxide reductase heme-binding subunit YedZ [Magnetovibrio sp.]HCS71830.1 sulfoxide reductase heme-binding subunit YedZ [Rhodospirillaceae bacterium]|tara:strand:- start:221 stop:856 length:636 start_codon:yes stop_codon:yes gene_type:complete
MNKETRLNWVLKPLVHAAALGPLVWLVWLGMHGQFGPNPAEFINRYTGDWAIRLLLIALAVTPVRGITGLAVVMRFRRMLGLYAFFYALLHVSSYVALDQYFAWAAIWQDILKRNYITVGMLGLVILTALAVTSPKAMVKKMGGRNWQRLHKLVYVAAVAAPVHFFMMRKGFQIEPLIYGGIAGLLLAYRAIAWIKMRMRSRAARADVQAA